MKWPEYNLKEIANVIMGQSPPGKTYNENGRGLPFFQGKAEFGHIYPTIKKWCTAPSRVAKQGDILLSVRAPVGPTNLAPCECCIGRGLAAIRARKGVAEQKYLWFFFKNLEPVLSKCGQGSTFTAINRAEINAIQVPLPPPSEQRRIVEILDQADALRKKRAEADAKAARILPALFYKMFGDPATNPKGWKVVKLGDVVLETQYGTSVRSNTLGQGLPVLRMNNINFNGYLDLTDLKYVDLPKREREKYLLTKGDILFNRTNSKELVGKTGLWRGEMEAVPASYLIRVRVDRNFVLPEFIWAYMNCPFVKQLLLNKARRAIGMANINARELRSLPLILPDRGSQEAFAEHIAALELLRSQRNRTALVIDQLFETLLHRAFTGDLTAQWREAHMQELLAEMEQQAKALETPISEDRPATIRIKHNKRRAKG